LSPVKSNKKTNKLNKIRTSSSTNKISDKAVKQKNNDNKNSKKATAGDSEHHNTDSEKGDDGGLRKLTDEECLEKMKELFTEYKGLTKTFMTRKLKKRIIINRKLDYNSDETYKDVELTIPKKSGSHCFLKVTIEICDKDELNLNSSLMCFIRDPFNSYFIVFKEKNKRMKIVIAGQITKDIISFLKKVSNEEFKNKHSVVTMKIKSYAFYEELITEFCKREGVVAKKINEAEIKVYLEEFNYLTKMRKAYDEIKLMKVDIN